MPTPQACCAHDHDCEAADCGPSYSLYKHIDTPRVRCLNEETDCSCQHVFRAWEARTQPPPVPLRSNEDDPDLLLHIPFDGAVKLKAISIIGGSGGSCPSKLKVYINRDDIDFSIASDLPALQEWDLQDDPRGLIEYPTQVAKFNGVHSLDLLFSGTLGAEQSEVLFVGLKGEFTERKRQAVVAVYESRAMPEDHKVPEDAHAPAWGTGA